MGGVNLPALAKRMCTFLSKSHLSQVCISPFKVCGVNLPTLPSRKGELPLCPGALSVQQPFKVVGVNLQALPKKECAFPLLQGEFGTSVNLPALP